MKPSPSGSAIASPAVTSLRPCLSMPFWSSYFGSYLSGFLVAGCPILMVPGAAMI